VVANWLSDLCQLFTILVYDQVFKRSWGVWLVHMWPVTDPHIIYILDFVTCYRCIQGISFWRHQLYPTFMFFIILLSALSECPFKFDSEVSCCPSTCDPAGAVNLPWTMFGSCIFVLPWQCRLSYYHPHRYSRISMTRSVSRRPGITTNQQCSTTWSLLWHAGPRDRARVPNSK
jgi:hypothetical protein